MDNSKKPDCCGDVVWVENIRDKGYWFCRGCKDEPKVKKTNTGGFEDPFFGGGFGTYSLVVHSNILNPIRSANRDVWEYTVTDCFGAFLKLELPGHSKLCGFEPVMPSGNNLSALKIERISFSGGEPEYFCTVLDSKGRFVLGEVALTHERYARATGKPSALPPSSVNGAGGTGTIKYVIPPGYYP